MLLGDIPYSEEIAQGLGHLPVVHVDIAIVHPVFGEGLAGGALGLGDLVFMVGKIRSTPPQWMSKVSPGNFMDMAEHSMPTGPAMPQGLFQAGSPGFWAFQGAKSMGFFFTSSTSTRLPAPRSSRFWPDSLP